MKRRLLIVTMAALAISGLTVTTVWLRGGKKNSRPEPPAALSPKQADDTYCIEDTESGQVWHFSNAEGKMVRGTC